MVVRTNGSDGAEGTTAAVAEDVVPRQSRARARREALRPVWEAYKATGDPQLRNQLVEAYHYLVRLMGNRVAARLPRSIDVHDLRSAGVFGLMRAIENFDIHKGTPFETYGALRVRGAILDELRRQDWVPRLVRNRTATWRAAEGRLRARLGREPMVSEVADDLGVATPEADRMRRESNLTSVFTLAAQEERDDDPRAMRRLDAMTDHSSELPFERLAAEDLSRALVEALTPSERIVVALYYHEGVTMKEIGHVMGISESRVCQIHSRCLERLRGHLEGQGDPLPDVPAPRWERN